jgi:steroid delta-isomerase-like uncharacterized protein
MFEKNKTFIKRYFDEVWNMGHLSVIDEIVADGYMNHDPANPKGKGPKGLKEFVAKYRNAFPDLNFVIEDMMAEGDKVITRYTWSGTHKGTFSGIPATGNSVMGSGILISRFSEGKLWENWANWDALGLMEQLGVYHMAA